MLFNSYEFIFLFFPIALSGYFFWGRFTEKNWANVWLALASFVFYGFWDWRYLPLLLGSIATNYVVAGLILRARRQSELKSAKLFFGVGLLFNVGLLGYYKYLDFLLDSLNVLGTHFSLLNIVLPLGISFFTITQLLYLFDCYEGVANDHHPVNYALFVSFFPHLVAGPILYHRQMMKQFRDESLRRVNWDNMSSGLSMFVIGLVKKVLIADTLSPYVSAGYGNPVELTMLGAWLTAVAYMLQLYFDFSGYSDMAFGLARMMNIEIPVNFNSPYRAASLINFWRRWHISLTNAITACIYMPIMRGFKTRTTAHTIVAAFVSFFIVGIWHGAGWTYVVFALLNAGGIVMNYLWREVHCNMPKFAAHTLTLLYVLVTMVFFRAADVGDALTVLQTMVGGNANIVEPPLEVIVAMVTAVALTAFSPNSNALIRRFRPSPIWAVFVTAGLVCSLFMMSRPTEFLYLQF